MKFKKYSWRVGVALLAGAAFIWGGLHAAKAFIPTISGGSPSSDEVAFGGVIQGVDYCQCPIPGALIKIGGFGGAFGGDVFYQPGSSVKIEGSGQFLRVGPFVLGSAKRSSFSCGTIESSSKGPFCSIFGDGLKLKSIGSFP